MLETATIAGLQEQVAAMVAPGEGRRAVDLGAGSGRFCEVLHARGYKVLGVDLGADFQSKLPLSRLDLNASFAEALPGPFDLVTAIEVIEHLENPIGFLRAIRGLLATDGVAIITTPNVDTLATRLRFAVSGRLRSFDAGGDPGHITPVFYDVLTRQWLPRARLRLAAYTTHGRHGMRPVLRLGLALARGVLRGGGAETHIFTFARGDH